MPAARLAVPTVQVRVSSPAAVHPLAGVNEVKDKAEQVQVVAGDPTAKVAAAAVLHIPSLQVLVLVLLLSLINHQRVSF